MVKKSNKFKRIKATMQKDDMDTPDICLIVSKEFLVFDKINNQIHIVIYTQNDLDSFRESQDKIKKLEIDKNWQNFNHYLAALKTKFRVKAKKAMELSSALLIEDVHSENIDNQLQKMTELYKRVASKADFNLGEFKLATYKDLKENLGDHYILKTYWLQNKMVGFLSGMIHGSELDAHFVGIDYTLNKSHAIYQRILYDYIDIAIKQKLTTINFGRTASEIKSSVGAIPEHLTVYIRHKKTITNKFLKLFLLKIQPTEFHQKFPFKIDKKSS